MPRWPESSSPISVRMCARLQNSSPPVLAKPSRPSLILTAAASTIGPGCRSRAALPWTSLSAISLTALASSSGLMGSAPGFVDSRG